MECGDLSCYLPASSIPKGVLNPFGIELARTSPCFHRGPCLACRVSEMTSDPKENPVRVGLISLGCAKNLVDAEIMLGSLLKGGVEIINDAAQADVVIVN